MAKSLNMCVICAGLAMAGTSASAQSAANASDGYVMGPGRWNCEEALKIVDRGTRIQKGQLAGWVLGFWSSSTFQRETAFVDTVEKVGGAQIYSATLTECQKAPGDTPLHIVVRTMIQNTN